MVEDKMQFYLQLFQLQKILALGDLAGDELGVYTSLLWRCLFVARTVKLAWFM